MKHDGEFNIYHTVRIIYYIVLIKQFELSKLGLGWLKHNPVPLAQLIPFITFM
jgi:hypothetical protein